MIVKHALVSLHRLSGESIHIGAVKEAGAVAIVLKDGTQLHWDSVADFEQFTDRMCQAVYADAEAA